MTGLQHQQPRPLVDRQRLVAGGVVCAPGGGSAGPQAYKSVGYATGNAAFSRIGHIQRPAPPPQLPGSSGSDSRSAGASSRSVPPCSRSGVGRPMTPSSAQYAMQRREQDARGHGGVAGLVGGTGGAQDRIGAADGSREPIPHGRLGHSAPIAGRSRSVAAPGARHGFSGQAGGAAATGGDAARCSTSTCDKCDGKHPSDRCPHFHKDREKHKDAWVNYGRKGNPHQMGASGGNFVLRSARVIRQPGDGSCLFHSLCHGLRSCSTVGCRADALRRELAQFLQRNPSLQIAGDTLEEWVRWDSNSTVADYARRMAISGWGGGIEMACCSVLKSVNVHVYENVGRGSGSEFKRISCFDAPNGASKTTIHVLYQGGVHYDALQPVAS
mmetsp:Transcript_25846/g.74471  ORF Transcript_25846/g.74471 Transcript_25846/m.74471 type:complete len:384 (+) Transcript_25846:209-1360(+)